jgi:hypothetical protein
MASFALLIASLLIGISLPPPVIQIIAITAVPTVLTPGRPAFLNERVVLPAGHDFVTQLVSYHVIIGNNVSIPDIGLPMVAEYVPPIGVTHEGHNNRHIIFRIMRYDLIRRVQVPRVQPEPHEHQPLAILSTGKIGLVIATTVHGKDHGTRKIKLGHACIEEIIVIPSRHLDNELPVYVGIVA